MQLFILPFWANGGKNQCARNGKGLNKVCLHLDKNIKGYRMSACGVNGSVVLTCWSLSTVETVTMSLSLAVRLETSRGPEPRFAIWVFLGNWINIFSLAELQVPCQCIITAKNPLGYFNLLSLHNALACCDKTCLSSQTWAKGTCTV